MYNDFGGEQGFTRIAVSAAQFFCWWLLIHFWGWAHKVTCLHRFISYLILYLVVVLISSYDMGLYKVEGKCISTPNKSEQTKTTGTLNKAFILFSFFKGM